MKYKDIFIHCFGGWPPKLTHKEDFISYKPTLIEYSFCVLRIATMGQQYFVLEKKIPSI